MKFMDNLMLRYARFCEKRKIIAEEKRKKYYLNYYNAYHNPDKLTDKELLEIFWKILKYRGYDVSNFNRNTGVLEPAKQDTDWNDLGNIMFATHIDRMFGFSKQDITDQEYEQLKTFGELADLIIKKAKEKKLKEKLQEQK
ncbi:MAG: hypothetical protein KKE11_02680 [Gammaproteobacteria bacterium]|nr:hypothetical protein [Gammaproteobacteria bacterium]